MTIKKVGILGGTFDPIHWGHLNLAFELMEKRHLDQVWFVPAQLNPFKTQTLPTSLDHRLAMVKLAIQSIPEFYLKDSEKKRPSPSYTIHTLQAFIKEQAAHPTLHQFYLLMGEDSVPGFFQWYLAEEIVQLVSLLIGSRSGIWCYPLDNHLSLPICQAIQAGLTPTRLMDISGTVIRQRLAQGLYCGHLVCASVLDYIQANQLYSSSLETTDPFP